MNNAANNVEKPGMVGGSMITVGSKAQVFHGTAHHTVGGLTRKDLMKNKRGKIVSYNRADERVTIEGLNLVKRHLKRTQDGQGGITEREAPIHRSNVMLGSLWDARRAKKPAKAAKK